MRPRLATALLGVVFLHAGAPSPGRKLTTIQRVETVHLEAVHRDRLKFAQERKTLPQLGVYSDYRAVMHVHAEDAPHTKGTRTEVLAGAKAAGVQVVMFTDHRGPKPDTWSGMRDGILFIPGSEDDHLLRFPKPDAELRFMSHLEETPDAQSAGFQGMEIYNRHTDATDEKAFDDYFRAAMKNPADWAAIASNQSRYPDEIYGAEQDYWPLLTSRWDKETTSKVFTGIAANDAHKNQTYNDVTFDPYDVAFRFVSTHILALNLTDGSIRESLRNGRVYVAHDWLCDPTGFSFVAGNNYGVYDLGDRVPMLPNTRLTARLPVAAHVKLIHAGTVVSESDTSEFSFTPKEAGTYRLEAWLTVDGEQRPWIYANPIFLESPDASRPKLPSTEISDSVDLRKDIVYTGGRDEDANKHKLDLYLPKGKSNFPVLVFIHGGSWRSGDRSIYAALGNRFAKEGMGVVIPSYRLMPGSPHPAQIEDATAAVDWVIGNIAQFGGDARRIYVSGHSAGGHLAAYVGLNPTFWPNIKGVLALSGVYDVSQIAGFRNSSTDGSPVKHIAAGAPPFLITYCENDYPSLPAQARMFDTALKSSGIPSELIYVPGENHISEIVHVVNSDDLTSRSMLRFLKEHP